MSQHNPKSPRRASAYSFKQSRILSVSCGLVILLLLALAGGCGPEQGDRQPQGKTTPAALAAGFATYEEVPVNITPAVKPYQVNKDLGNVTNKDMFHLSPAARELLTQNGFVVVPSHATELDRKSVV